MVDAAYRVIEDLVQTYQVESTSGDPRVDFPDWAGSAHEVIRLDPSRGAPLAFMFTDFPGVVVRVGDWGFERFPVCGCDACNESPRELVENLRDIVGAAAAGEYEEELTKRTLTHRYAGRSSSFSTEVRLDRGEWNQYGAPASHRWPAWLNR